MKISDILASRHVIFGVRVKDKEELILQALSVLKPDVSPSVFATLRDAVMEREKLMSTGVGKGVAIPHAKIAGLEQNMTAFAIIDSPVEYDSIDGSPVDLLFLLVGPVDNRNHIRLLSRISKMMNKDAFRRSLKACETQEEVIACFRKEEESSADM